jgi:hypothetical protein
LKTPAFFYCPELEKELCIMAIFRIEKTQNYTVMSNHHLRNVALSLKAKGLLSQMLSLPENWDYTLAGLSRINRESVDAIRTAVHELEREGYITRSRERKENGQLGGAEYIIREQPPEDFTPDNDPAPPIQKNPISENPTQANSILENTTQINKECKVIKEKEINTDLLNTDSILFPPQTPPFDENGNGTETASTQAFEIYREIIRGNLSYPIMIERYKYDKARIDEIVDLMLETVCTSRKTFRIAGDDYPAELVKAKFLKLHSGHLEFVLDCMKKNTTEIRNIKKYLLAVLFNATTTMDNYYTALVAHDMADGI